MVVFAVFPKWTVDDAYITYRYAENFAYTGEFRWNVGEQPVEGYTGIALPFALAGAIRMGVAPDVAAKTIGVTSYVIAAIAFVLLLGRLGVSDLVRGAFGFLYLSTPALFTHASSGLEVSNDCASTQAQPTLFALNLLVNKGKESRGSRTVAGQKLGLRGKHARTSRDRAPETSESASDARLESVPSQTKPSACKTLVPLGGKSQMYIRSSLSLLVVGIMLSLVASLEVRADTGTASYPSLVFSTNLGTSGYARAESVASDTRGDLYIVGAAKDAHFGGSPKINVLGTPGGNTDVFVLKLDASGTAIDFVTLIGGAAEESARSVALDASGNIYIVAVTSSGNLPVAGGLHRPYASGTDAYLAKLSPSGDSLIYATYLGGSSEEANPRVAVSRSGQATVVLASLSSDFPVTSGPAPSPESFAAVAVSISPGGDQLVYSRKVADTGIVSRLGIAANHEGDVLVVGTGFLTRLTSDGHESATASRDLLFERVTIDAAGDVYTAALALDDRDLPGQVVLQKWSSDLREILSETRFTPRFNFRVELGDLAVDGDANLYLTDFEDGSTENYYGAVRRIDREGRLTFEQLITDALVGLSLTPSRQVGVAGNSFFAAPTFNALVPDRGTFRLGFATQLKFPTEVGVLPTITAIERQPRKANPLKFRTVISGSGFQTGARVFVGDSKAPDTLFVVKSATRIVRKSELQTNGEQVELTILNLDGGEAHEHYSR